MGYQRLGTAALFFAGTATIIASGSPVPVDKPPKDPIKLVEKQDDPQCTCTNAFGWYVNNSDTRNRAVNYYWTKTDTIGNTKTYGSSSKTAIAGDDTFLSCSIERGPLGCNTEWFYELGNNTVTTSSKALAGFGSGEREQSLEVCKALCGSGDPACFDMGPAFAKIGTPLAELYFKAVGNNEALIAKSDVLKTYGLEGQTDKCERSDVTLENGGATAINIAQNGLPCEVKALDMLQMLPQLKLTATDVSELSNLTLWVQPKIRAEVVRALTATGQTDMVTFPRNVEGLNLQFTGASGDAATAAYGSYLLAMQQVGKTLVIQTANGCISSPLP